MFGGMFEDEEEDEALNLSAPVVSSALVDVDQRGCAACGKEFSCEEYSKKQWRKDEETRRCISCVKDNKQRGWYRENPEVAASDEEADDCNMEGGGMFGMFDDDWGEPAVEPASLGPPPPQAASVPRPHTSAEPARPKPARTFGKRPSTVPVHPADSLYPPSPVARPWAERFCPLHRSTLDRFQLQQLGNRNFHLGKTDRRKYFQTPTPTKINGPVQPHKPKKISQDDSSRMRRIEKGNQYMRSTVQASSGWRSMLPSEQMDLRMPPMSRGKFGQRQYSYVVFGGTPEALAAIEAANRKKAADKKAAEDAEAKRLIEAERRRQAQIVAEAELAKAERMATHMANFAFRV